MLADPLLLGRGLDRVLEHVLTVARGDVRVGAAVAADGRVRVEVTRPRTEPADAVQRLADPEGVVHRAAPARRRPTPGGRARVAPCRRAAVGGHRARRARRLRAGARARPVT
ncbi:MAG: hypothetical protein KIT58_00260 [Planctomycetota bacterium]|nr:hypothetical protein [Planctomycetota bacterium]